MNIFKIFSKFYNYIILHKLVLFVFVVILVFSSFVFTAVYKRFESKKDNRSLIISENKDTDNDGTPDWLERLIGTSETNRHIKPNQIALRQERRFLGAEIASTIESQGGALTPEGSEELAQVISDTILKELDESIPTVNISLRPSAILDRGLFKNQLLYALSPLLDPQTNFSVTLRDAVSENSTSFASLARLESACIHLINNLPNEVPTDLIDLYSNLVNRLFGICVPLLQYADTKSSNVLLQIVSAVTGDLRNTSDEAISPQSISWLSYYLHAIFEVLEKEN